MHLNKVLTLVHFKYAHDLHRLSPVCFSRHCVNVYGNKYADLVIWEVIRGLPQLPIFNFPDASTLTPPMQPSVISTTFSIFQLTIILPWTMAKTS